MNFKEYRTKINLFNAGKFDQNNLTTVLEWLTKDGLNIYKEEFKRISGVKKLPDTKEIQLIEQAIPKNRNDWYKKISDQNYYTSNVIMFTEICK